MRMRSEGLERLRRELEAEHGRLNANGMVGMSHYNPDRPWNAAFRAACGPASKDFWDEELKDKAVLFLASIRSRASLADDQTGHNTQDAPIEAAVPSAGQPGQRPPPPHPSRPAPPPPSPPPRRATDGHPQTDGSRYINRAGLSLCADYNQGRGAFRHPFGHRLPSSATPCQK